MTTRLKFIIESDDYTDISVDYDASAETVSIGQDDDRISIPLDAIEEVRAALYEQKAALEEVLWEEEQAEKSEETAASQPITGFARFRVNVPAPTIGGPPPCDSMYPGQGVTCRLQQHGADKMHEGTDGEDEFSWEAE